jgi:aminopeptidase N
MAIQNDRPIIGVYDVNQEGSTDMYYKGANILHTLRQLINDDEKWRKILRGLNMVFYHQTVSSKQIEEYISKESGINLTKFWDQYLRTVQIPTLEYKKSEHLLSYRYTNMIENFRMPIIAIINGEENWIYPTDKWKTDTYADELINLKIKDDFYINSIEIN